jgi:hypothetical protein
LFGENSRNIWVFDPVDRVTTAWLSPCFGDFPRLPAAPTVVVQQQHLYSGKLGVFLHLPARRNWLDRNDAVSAAEIVAT